MFTQSELESIEKLLKLLDGSTLQSGILEKEGMQIRFDKHAGGASALIQDRTAGTSYQKHADPRDPQPIEILDEPETGEADIECKAPFLGNLHLEKPGDSGPLIQVGQKVKKGDVVFLLEAMKLLNEVQAPADGEITEILCQHGDLVQYGDVVLKLKESDLDD